MWFVRFADQTNVQSSFEVANQCDQSWLDGPTVNRNNRLASTLCFHISLDPRAAIPPPMDVDFTTTTTATRAPSRRLSSMRPAASAAGVCVTRLPRRRFRDCLTPPGPLANQPPNARPLAPPTIRCLAALFWQRVRDSSPSDVCRVAAPQTVRRAAHFAHLLLL